MKVLFTTNILAFYRVDFFNELGKKCDLTVMYEKDKNNERNKKFYNFKNENFKLVKVKYSLNFFNKLLKNNYDIIVIGTYATKISALFMHILKLKKINFIINADGGFINYKENKLSKGLKTHFIKMAKYYLSTGKETNKYLEYYGAKKDNIFIYPFTSLFEKEILNEPISKEEKNKLREKYDIKKDFVYLSVGRFIHLKGYDVFLKSIKNDNLDKIEFILISGGEEKENYINYMRDNNINNVKLIDYCTKEELKEYYKMADVFFFPSRKDVWGLVINEALAYGLPIISSNNVIASLELIDKKYLYDPEDYEQLYKLMKKMLEIKDEDRKRIGTKNLTTSKEYTIENMVKKHIEIFKEILKNEKNKRI